MDGATDGKRLVLDAITSGTSGCIEWKSERLQLRVRQDPELLGLTPKGVVAELVAAVRAAGEVRQKRETRPEWAGQFEFVYEVRFPVAGLPRDLYVELVLKDPPDVDCPVVIIVSAHLTSR